MIKILVHSPAPRELEQLLAYSTLFDLEFQFC